jgi:phage tail sheath protein FI
MWSEAGQALAGFHKALLTLCAARSDLFALLSLPGHYRGDAASEHVNSLKAPVPTDRLWSFGALYHPWLIMSEDSPAPSFRMTPPDGTVCGMIARRTLARGAWIAPANEPLLGPVELTPGVGADRLVDLQALGINPIRQEPRGFLTLSAYTLSDDPDYESIHVRRLLILLRRLALRQGADYVFEPNSPAFRRSVQRGFEILLGDMFLRGAFAGATPDTAFRVVTNDKLNTAASVDQGRFLVELQVAPAQPLVFLTVRLVQTGNQSLVVQEG